MDSIENYDVIRDLADGNGGRVTRLMRYKPTGELVAVKFIPRGDRVDQHVLRELINHRSLRHPNVILFRRAFLTPTHLAIAMDFASGGELLDLLSRASPLPEPAARFLFHQLIAGVSYLHSMYVCHRDLKPENILIDGPNPKSPQLKICDFGYSKSGVLHSRPKSMVGTPSYVAPEVLAGREYDGKAADVWSCGVILYIMVVGEYPFIDLEDRRNLRKVVEKILAVDYSIPDNCGVSLHCRQLISSILVKDPKKRFGIREIRKHPWFVKDLREEVSGGLMDKRRDLQSVAEIKRIVEEARIAPKGAFDEEEEEVVVKEFDEEVEEVREAMQAMEVKEAPKVKLGRCRSSG